MSIKVLLEDLNDEKRKQIANDLEFTTKASYYAQQFGQDEGNTIYAFEIRDEYIHVPFNYGYKTLNLERPTRSNFRKTGLKFNGKLRKLQKQVKKEAVSLLNKNSSCIISLYTGGGKTATSINIAISIGMPVLVVVTRLVLMDQWEKSIKKFCPEAKIYKIKTKKDIPTDQDFYIVNAINIPKFSDEKFDHIGTLIADEMHLLGTEKLSTAFHYVHPRYALGLSATPTRPDGMDALLHSYFGNKQVHRQLNRAHTAYKVETWKYIDVNLEVKTTNTGTLDWNSILNSQANSEPRNKLIIHIIQMFPEHCFLILCKRVSHAKKLEKMLTDIDIDVTSLVGVKRSFDTNARVLVATVQKAGVGFDHPKLNALMIAADVEQYFIQYLGRVFRTEYGSPLIFDFVDDFRTLKKHFSSRSAVYRKHGGTIKNFYKEFGELELK